MKFKVTSFIISLFVFTLIMGGYLYSDEGTTLISNWEDWRKLCKEWHTDPYEETYFEIEGGGVTFSAFKYVGDIPKRKEQPPQKKEANYQTWKLPIYMQENLQWMLNDFNKRFDEKVQGYKKELKTRFTEFKDMPDDAVLYLEGGIFIERSDYLRLQRYIRDIENLANKQIPKEEVKKDGK